MMVSANFFQTFGVQPALGRAFIPGVEDTDPGAHPVAVLGVAPPDFRGPVNYAASRSRRSESTA